MLYSKSSLLPLVLASLAWAHAGHHHFHKRQSTSTGVTNGQLCGVQIMEPPVVLDGVAQQMVFVVKEDIIAVDQIVNLNTAQPVMPTRSLLVQILLQFPAHYLDTFHMELLLQTV